MDLFEYYQFLYRRSEKVPRYLLLGKSERGNFV